MLRCLEIVGLNDKINQKVEFNSDITILTGPNGSGKTNILKLIWYLFSPNLERAYEEIDFESATLTTDSFIVTLDKLNGVASLTTSEGQTITVEVERTFDGKMGVSNASSGRNNRRINPSLFELDKINEAIWSFGETSLFFPTYRRIEEGRNSANREMEDLAIAIRALAHRVSAGNHRLIASVSADDIVRLISNKYAATSNKALALRDELLQNITKQLKRSRDSSDNSTYSISPDKLINRIIDDVEDADAVQSELFAPFDSINEILKEFMDDKSIVIDGDFVIGEIGNKIDVDYLSAGEKQILSFLAYNSFYSNALIVIDEPELSLHIDWQRALLPALEKQGSTNQIIVATHSPFIYANYPEKEVILAAASTHE